MIPFIHIGSLQIPSFFLVISLSLSALLFMLSKRVERFSKDRKTAFDIALLLMISGFVGGRLMHVFYEEWDFYRQNPANIFYFWNGGFVFLGGVLLCLVSGFVFTRIRKLDFQVWADFFTPLFSLSHALGRVGCLLSGCCFGAYCELPWSVSGRHPTALYLMLGELLIFSFLIFVERKKPQPKGVLFLSWLFLHSAMRFIVEYFRADFRGLFLRLPFFGELSVSQLISLGIIGVSAYFLTLKFMSHSETPAQR